MSSRRSVSTRAGMTELVERTLREAGDLLERGEVSAVELTEAVLQRIDETEPLVHAYAHVFAERALASAHEADRELAQGARRGPLHGVPIAVKDIVYMRDAPTEAGSRVLAGFVPDYDATIVRRLVEAGAVIVGKTVTMEFAWGTNVPVTRNPWRDGCYPGGSSAGSGVTVSVRSAFGAIGTDTGGSVRIPAAVNGIVGLKPTFGRVSRYGVIPLGWSFDHVGTLTRTVDDNAILLQALSGYDPADLGSIDEPVPDYRVGLEDGAEGAVIGVEREHHFYPGVTDDVRDAVEGVIEEYARLGARIVEVRLPGVRGDAGGVVDNPARGGERLPPQAPPRARAGLRPDDASHARARRAAAGHPLRHGAPSAHAAPAPRQGPLSRARPRRDALADDPAPHRAE